MMIHPNNENILKLLRFIKSIRASIFENKTPLFHIEVLRFILSNPSRGVVSMFRGAGKSTLINKIYIFLAILFFKERFILICSSNSNKAELFLNEVKGIIIDANISGVNIHKGRTWKSDIIEVVVNKGTTKEHKSYIVSLGAGQDPRGFIMQDSRPTLIVCDDIESHEGQYAIANKRNREKLSAYVFQTLLPSLNPNSGRAIFIGTILHEDSIISRLLNDESYSSLYIPILKDGKSVWSDRFPISKIEEIKDELIRENNLKGFYNEYLLKPYADENVLFKKEMMRYFKHIEYNKEVEYIKFNNQTITIPKPTHIVLLDDSKIDLNSCTIYSTMDLASDGRDKTAITTFAVDSNKDIYLLDITVGHFNPDVKSRHVIRLQRTFKPIRFGIERAGAMNEFFYTIEKALQSTNTPINIYPLKPKGVAKNIRISNLMPYFISKSIYFNKEQPQTLELEAELLTFDPDVDSKRDDIMDALAYMVYFIAYRRFDSNNTNNKDDNSYYEDEALMW